MLRVTCPSCRSRLKVPSQMGGKKGSCPKCRAELLIAAAEPGDAPAAGGSGFVIGLTLLLLLGLGGIGAFAAYKFDLFKKRPAPVVAEGPTPTATTAATPPATAG